MLFFRVDLSIYLKMHTKSNLYNDYDESKLNNCCWPSLYGNTQLVCCGLTLGTHHQRNPCNPTTHTLSHTHSHLSPTSGMQTNVYQLPLHNKIWLLEWHGMASNQLLLFILYWFYTHWLTTFDQYQVKMQSQQLWYIMLSDKTCLIIFF